jgi:hypothetical protein
MPETFDQRLLKRRLGRSGVAPLGQAPAQELATPTVDYRRQGMRPIEVREILGDAHRVDGGYFTRWHYKNGGAVVFANEEVNEWTEPQQ